MDRDFAPTPWEPLPVDENPPPGRGWIGAGIRLGLLFVVLPLVAFGGIYLAIFDAAGTVRFGGNGVECTIGDQSEVFSAGEAIYAAVTLERGVTPGEVLTMRLMQGGITRSEIEFVIEGTGTCDTQLVDDGRLDPGRYRVTYTVGDELLAEGDFEVVGAPGVAAATSEA